MIHISLAAEHLWDWGSLPVTNGLLTTWIVMALLLIFTFFATRKLSMIPSTIQLIAEMVIGGLYDFFSSVAGKYVKQFFPIVATLFIYILISNWLGLLPGVGTIGFPHEGHPIVPLLRSPMADLNTTIALALITVVAMQFFGFRNLGAHYTSRFISFKDPVSFAVGFLEIISDLSKITSFAFRLFGNIFAGEVLLAVMAFLMPFLVPLPFLAMELFVGVIQALVFSMLAAAFFTVAASHEEAGHGEGVSKHG
jgi:F-type H+-transporting ATPase subunit a